MRLLAQIIAFGTLSLAAFMACIVMTVPHATHDGIRDVCCVALTFAGVGIGFAVLGGRS
jgi:hypothetical protein